MLVKQARSLHPHTSHGCMVASSRAGGPRCRCSSGGGGSTGWPLARPPKKNESPKDRSAARVAPEQQRPRPRFRAGGGGAELRALPGVSAVGADVLSERRRDGEPRQRRTREPERRRRGVPSRAERARAEPLRRLRAVGAVAAAAPPLVQERGHNYIGHNYIGARAPAGHADRTSDYPRLTSLRRRPTANAEGSTEPEGIASERSLGATCP